MTYDPHRGMDAEFARDCANAADWLGRLYLKTGILDDSVVLDGWERLLLRNTARRLEERARSYHAACRDHEQQNLTNEIPDDVIDMEGEEDEHDRG